VADAGSDLITSYGYDNAGRQQTATDALGRLTRFEYDALGRVVRTIQEGDPGTTAVGR